MFKVYSFIPICSNKSVSHSLSSHSRDFSSLRVVLRHLGQPPPPPPWSLTLISSAATLLPHRTPFLFASTRLKSRPCSLIASSISPLLLAFHCPTTAAS